MSPQAQSQFILEDANPQGTCRLWAPRLVRKAQSMPHFRRTCPRAYSANGLHTFRRIDRIPPAVRITPATSDNRLTCVGHRLVSMSIHHRHSFNQFPPEAVTPRPPKQQSSPVVSDIESMFLPRRPSPAMFRYSVWPSCAKETRRCASLPISRSFPPRSSIVRQACPRASLGEGPAVATSFCCPGTLPAAQRRPLRCTAASPPSQRSLATSFMTYIAPPPSSTVYIVLVLLYIELRHPRSPFSLGRLPCRPGLGALSGP